MLLLPGLNKLNFILQLALFFFLLQFHFFGTMHANRLH